MIELSRFDDVTIRPAVLEDIPAIVLLNAQELGYDYPPEKAREQLSRLLSSAGHRILVAQLGEKIAGYVHAQDYLNLYAPPLKNIMGIAVSSDYRRQGIGRALLEAVEAWARETGAAGIRLVSGESRKGAHAFYRCCGYDGGKKQLNFKKYL